MRYLLVLPAAILLTLATNGRPIRGAEEPAAARSKIHVLLLSGQNNHDWKTTTPKIRSLLTATGRFTLDVAEHPEELTKESLSPYDVIVSNWNNWSTKDWESASWPEAAATAYVQFVRSGKGHVVLHAGSSSFPNWADYQRLSLATWKRGQTGHGPYHEFSVRIDVPHHPITIGISPFTTCDELWHKAAIGEGATVLASAFSSLDKGGSGNDEPVALVGRFGQGRCFTLLLGHDTKAMENPGFVALLVRGTEWAARREEKLLLRRSDIATRCRRLCLASMVRCVVAFSQSAYQRKIEVQHERTNNHPSRVPQIHFGAGRRSGCPLRNQFQRIGQ